MTFLIKLSIIVICMISLSLAVGTNATPKKSPLEDKKILELAWSEYRYFKTDKGYIVIKDPLVLKAKLEIFDWLFMPKPFDNRFQNMISDFEREIRRMKIGRIFVITGSIALGILTGIGTGKIYIKIKSK